MPVIDLATRIVAPVELCFDVARDIDVHIESTEGTREVAVAGVTHGLIGLNEEVTWEATHLGVRQRLTSRIIAFDRPRHFRDSQVRGPFRRFDHDHFFTNDGAATIMRDVFDYNSPCGWLGRCVDRLFLRNYMEGLLRRRADVIKRVAEAAAPAAASTHSHQP